MELQQRKISTTGIKFFLVKDGTEIGRAYLYLIYNDLHHAPFGLMEDVFVDEQYRGQGLGSKLVRAVIEAAKQQKCYKLVGTSRYARPEVHAWYQELGFKDYGKEFRMDF